MQRNSNAVCTGRPSQNASSLGDLTVRALPRVRRARKAFFGATGHVRVPERGSVSRSTFTNQISLARFARLWSGTAAADRRPVLRSQRSAAVAPNKAPGDWRTPRRFANVGRLHKPRQRPGVRWPSTAFPQCGKDFVLPHPSPLPKERERPSAVSSFANDCSTNSALGFSKTQRAFFLLPGGEGRDEGGRHTKKSNFLFCFSCG